MPLLTRPLNYSPHPEDLFACLRHLPWPMLLDSGKPRSKYGRYDILVAQPCITLRSFENQDGEFHTEICEAGNCLVVAGDPFVLLRDVLARYPLRFDESVPFAGGALGYWGYDLVRALEVLPNISIANLNLPQMLIGIYDWAVVIDHQQKTTNLVSHGLFESTRRDWKTLCTLLTRAVPAQNTSFEVSTPVAFQMSEARYRIAFETIQEHIRAGDCYQVNLAQRFSVQASGDGWIAYQKLRALSGAPFMAYLNAAGIEVLCSSPERFLEVRGQRVQACPIKGTRRRSSEATADARLIEELSLSAKDHAENLMIVDLLRNDLGKTCAVGSVKVQVLCRLQSYSNVHHLVSVINARLGESRSPVDLLRSAFPGGSITGAPKIAAMRIIENLETHRRGVYCGAIGYIGFDGQMDSNIAIRTAVYMDGELSGYAGGGIVSDSDGASEYCETLDKASHLLAMMRYFYELYLKG